MLPRSMNCMISVPVWADAGASPRIVPLWWLLDSLEVLLIILFQPCDGIEQITASHTKKRSDKLPDDDDIPEPWQHKFDELVGLIQIILAGDVVFAVSPVSMLLAVIGNFLLFTPILLSSSRGFKGIPNSLLALGTRWVIISRQMQDCHKTDLTPVCGNGPDGKDLTHAHVQDLVLLVKGDGCDFAADFGRHDFVPAVYAVDQVAAVFGGASTAEGMRELSIGREVFLYCFCLEGRWSFC